LQAGKLKGFDQFNLLSAQFPDFPEANNKKIKCQSAIAPERAVHFSFIASKPAGFLVISGKLQVTCQGKIEQTN